MNIKNIKDEETLKKAVMERLWQLRKSGLWKKKVDEELKDVHTKEEARDYINKAGEMSISEKADENRTRRLAKESTRNEGEHSSKSGASSGQEHDNQHKSG